MEPLPEPTEEQKRRAHRHLVILYCAMFALLAMNAVVLWLVRRD